MRSLWLVTGLCCLAGISWFAVNRIMSSDTQLPAPGSRVSPQPGTRPVTSGIAGTPADHGNRFIDPDTSNASTRSNDPANAHDGGVFLDPETLPAAAVSSNTADIRNEGNFLDVDTNQKQPNTRDISVMQGTGRYIDADSTPANNKHGISKAFDTGVFLNPDIQSDK
jgi:hypothetical protein